MGVTSFAGSCAMAGTTAIHSPRFDYTIYSLFLSTNLPIFDSNLPRLTFISAPSTYRFVFGISF